MATALKQPVLRQALEWTPLAEGTFGQPETEGGGSDGGWTKRRAWAGVWAEVAVGDCAASDVCLRGRVFIRGLQRVRLLQQLALQLL